MALFREHVTVGAVISMIVVVTAYFYALVTDPLLLGLLFLATIIGSFLPDIDSDSGIPFYMIFGGVTLAVTGIALLFALKAWPDDWRFFVGVPLFIMAVCWFVIGSFVKQMTKHRGIYHSLPALLIAGLLTYLVALKYGFDETSAIVFGGALSVGFASHLILDEIHASVTMNGIPFIPNKAFGSALKLFSNSRGVNLLTYLLLIILAYTALY